MSTVQQTYIGRVGIVPILEEQEEYDYLDVRAKNGRCYLSLKEANRDDVDDLQSWMQLVENNYDMAVRLGIFEGTEEEWIASLSAASEKAAALTLEQINECKEVTQAATNATEEAVKATNRMNTLSDHPPVIINGTWWVYNEETKEREDTGQVANGNVYLGFFFVDPQTGELCFTAVSEYAGPTYGMNENGELTITV
ncbi:MAG: hypothetical protein LUD74_03585 [Tannerellaceae bacterium]|nr:hypothetical protein [Tannerellaceae bacterium]